MLKLASVPKTNFSLLKWIPKKLSHTTFWVFVTGLLIVLFGMLYGSYTEAFYFVTMLLPVVIGTSYFFKNYLIHRFLLRKKTGTFILYSLYMLVISLYLEMIVIVLSFIFIAEFNYAEQLPINTNIIVLASTLYCVVFLYSFLDLVKQHFHHQHKIAEYIEKEDAQQESYLLVKSERKLNKIPTLEILYVESLGDYVKIHPESGKAVLTREKISKLQAELPANFIRIHRSFIVNTDKIENFNREQLEITDTCLPISRTYRKAVWKFLSKR